MKLGDRIWKVRDDRDGEVRGAVDAALRRIGWDSTVVATWLTYGRVDAAGDTARDTDPVASMIDKFASTFAAISNAVQSGAPAVQEYDAHSR